MLQLFTCNYSDRRQLNEIIFPYDENFYHLQFVTKNNSSTFDSLKLLMFFDNFNW